MAFRAPRAPAAGVAARQNLPSHCSGVSVGAHGADATASRASALSIAWRAGSRYSVSTPVLQGFLAAVALQPAGYRTRYPWRGDTNVSVSAGTADPAAAGEAGGAADAAEDGDA